MTGSTVQHLLQTAFWKLKDRSTQRNRLTGTLLDDCAPIVNAFHFIHTHHVWRSARGRSLHALETPRLKMPRATLVTDTAWGYHGFRSLISRGSIDLNLYRFGRLTQCLTYDETQAQLSHRLTTTHSRDADPRRVSFVGRARDDDRGLIGSSLALGEARPHGRASFFPLFCGEARGRAEVNVVTICGGPLR